MHTQGQITHGRHLPRRPTESRPGRAQIEAATRAHVAPAERPGRAQIEPAALALLSRHSAGLLATARRYSMSPQDAEDAYQRGVEILLTKAPTTSEDELLPWLRTVVKHEAFAVRRSSGRALPSEDPLDAEAEAAAWTDERAERYERLRLGAEAMSALKPQEIRCLLLKAEGLSYREICETTGFSYTKVNRCLTEGRRAFLQRVARIESGAECERLAPLISKVADGEASPDEMRALRPHLKGCLACKATLREYRATPARLAGLVPPVVALAGSGGGATSVLSRIFHSVHDRLAGVPELAGAKVAAVAASAVVVTGGGAAGVRALHHDPPAVPKSAFEVPPTASKRTTARVPRLTAPAVGVPMKPATTASPDSAREPTETAGERTAKPPRDIEARPTPTEARSTDPAATPAPEFDPGTAGASSPTSVRTLPRAAPESALAPPASSAPAGEFGP